MRELQFDDIAIPCLGIANLLVMRQGRKRGAEAVRATVGLSVDAECRKRLFSVLFDFGTYWTKRGGIMDHDISPSGNYASRPTAWTPTQRGGRA
ncbi:hypothetical protein N2603_41110 [Bradyrhizobium huanghuaihaiense]|uniref:hypothetical protein n=1 Tax=Bradyrhizobium huanghuaihaiense TaxID=990078 RepID=UPI0021A9BDF3|nr:hypothetical protein [Bradyrhizobium sp. CB3035]UWU76214.1 hypothetical protein N2603_41110 [Bradyrhizobium sp. CB3035]